jgi:SAM-dependent methyltransferase
MGTQGHISNAHAANSLRFAGEEQPEVAPRAHWLPELESLHMPASTERERWNQKYRENPGAWLEPDPFLTWAFSAYLKPLFPRGGSALDLAGGAGRHAVWLAKQGWEVTLIDVSETGAELARQNAGPLASHIHLVIDDLTQFRASQTQFEVVLVFFYLQREIFPEIVKAVRPGGILLYKTYTLDQRKLPGGPRDASHLLAPGELVQLVSGMHVLHAKETVAEKATAEIVARRERVAPSQPDRTLTV